MPQWSTLPWARKQNLQSQVQDSWHPWHHTPGIYFWLWDAFWLLLVFDHTEWLWVWQTFVPMRSYLDSSQLQMANNLEKGNSVTASALVCLLGAFRDIFVPWRLERPLFFTNFLLPHPVEGDFVAFYFLCSVLWSETVLNSEELLKRSV
jgi:hypothetical protein